ncbi:hypothetical protein HGRIS_007228 [Hohenbuehelia grisea]|uniref:Copper transport protein n=1 Tax=Hohenbuehelia grisea TaxID=104357 RepID=A0ABR3JBJ5_9AGAR
MLTPEILAVVALCLHVVSAHDNGMDMDMDGAMQLASGHMLPYLHFTLGDALWFQGWVPKSTGAMVGTCIGLFLLAIVERWIAAMRAMMEVHWRKSAQIALSQKLNRSQSSIRDEEGKSRSVTSLLTMRTAPPFILSHNIARGVMHVGQTALGFAFMLAVMTFQLGFIFAIVLGAGVGETIFGRFISGATHM